MGEFAELRIPDVLVILMAAQQLCIPHLIYICEQFIRSELSVFTVFILLKQATLLKMDDMRELAIDFAHEKWAEVACNREGLDMIGIELFQELTVLMQQKKSTPIEPLKAVENTFVADFKEIFDVRMFTDAEAVFTDDPEPIKFHRAIVGAYSRPLLNLISQSKTKQFTFEGINSVAFNDLLQFIYYGKTQFNPLGACLLLEHSVVPLQLHSSRERLIQSITDGISLESVIPILRVSYLSHVRQKIAPKLRENLFRFTCEHFQELDIPSLRTIQPPEVGYQLMADVVEALYYFRSGRTHKGDLARHSSELVLGSSDR